MANDFMNWRISTSFRLLGTPHRKNSAVTRKKGRRCPAGKSGWWRVSLVAGLAMEFDICIECPSVAAGDSPAAFDLASKPRGRVARDHTINHTTHHNHTTPS